jgi:long-chain acyl-CoA synthetase
VGEAGELLIKGPQVMKGYLEPPEATAETITEDGWLCTGDIAKMDEDGYFFIVDRKKDMIISGGYNVYPRDIDEVLSSIPKSRKPAPSASPIPNAGSRSRCLWCSKRGKRPPRRR